MVRFASETVKVNELAPGLKTMRSSLTARPRSIAVVLETSNVATSLLPLGTVAGVQLEAAPQLLFVGLRFQVALPA